MDNDRALSKVAILVSPIMPIAAIIWGHALCFRLSDYTGGYILN